MNKKLLTVAIAGAMAAPMAAQAVKFKVSGHINRAILYQDDGEQSDIRSVGAANSSSRLRVRGSEKLDNGMEIGMYGEWQFRSHGSSAARPDLDADPGDSTGTIRHSNVYFSGNWGKLTLGQTGEGSDGKFEADLSGTGLVDLSTRTSFVGSMFWRTNAGGTIGGLQLGDTAPSLDASRRDVIRYDSPALGPVGIAASVANDQNYALGLGLNTGLGGGEISAGLFYHHDSGRGYYGDGVETDWWGGSASFLFSQGTSITGAYGQIERDEVNASDVDQWYVKLGHKWGMNAVSISYSEHSWDGLLDDFEHSNFGVGFVHTLKKANSELYALFQFHELDTPAGISAEDAYMFVVGARVKFQ